MVLLRIALRNLWLHKFKTFVVGAILFLGTAVVVVGNAILDAVDKSMAVSLVNSVAGHLQIYSEDAPDEFEIFRGLDSSARDVGHIEDFARVKAALEALPNVQTVVPMGIDYAVVLTGNILDRRLSELREALDNKDMERAGVILAHVRRIVRVLSEELKNLNAIADMDRVEEDSKAEMAALAEAQKEEFWAQYDTEPYTVVEFLENKVAKLAFGEDLIWLNYIGTDTAVFEKTFDRFEIVDGEPIPPGQRGFLFNKRNYERFVKNKTARRLDRIEERLADGMPWSECEDCETWVNQNVRQAASLAYQMDDVAAAEVVAGLQEALETDEPSLVPLLEALLDMDQGNFSERYALFYDLVAPRIVLYTINVGDVLVLTAFGRGGYVRRVPVKVYGTFKFRSLDRSPLAGGFNLMDLMTFRDLYGYMTAEKLEEITTIREEVGARDVSSDTSEEDFFGGGEGDGGEPPSLEEARESSTFDPTEGMDMKAGGERYTEAVHKRIYAQTEIDDGVVLNAAVMLEDGDELEETAEAIRLLNEAKGLGIQVITWRKASGLVGEFVGVIRAVLYGAVFVIFVVALVIINNSMMMSTMERTTEIGTMRAIGAQRGFVRRMILVETAVLAVIFGGAGALLGSGLVIWMQVSGVPAWNDITYFLFAGPRFHPELLGIHLVIALIVISLVGFASTFYPALLATRITPREAMAKED